MNQNDLRIGHGFDVHPFGSEPGKSLILGGVEFDLPGLVAHSDGDVVIHSVIDSLVSPIGLGDIGSLFSDQDPNTEGQSSLAYLAQVAQMVSEAGWLVANIDLTLVADKPKISDCKAQMISNIETVTGGHISIKGKRTEGVLHSIPAVSCHATSLLVRGQSE